ncbi:Phage integrase:Phage integrase, N-terminal SAM- like [Frigoriglobus tundricola]|uniref:Phage integrase:Phage integrase, N-terminal SAM-like n=1 Tax=Frigoriglobus tundricola TaxID=2774151 RepID=A0A6M5YMP8_9BACT|nr:hypothetical protein FTUN_0005 [Frigoriglobus tundricola]QJW94181.1 Phage integrase:Phage integrase, N-terminal SAM- like [Frigoriglobus tundricola]QJW95215.1 Phage integrase:Phage integrase, N-terminal SAM- like [Frigoriglobus tundricola]QJW97157.1 Phage integrase:Phage integrase, N-terminal SAM- like [Frigoriglobus tundricola]
MVRRRAIAANIETAIGCHTFRATGITNSLVNGGALEKAQQLANHESARTTELDDRLMPPELPPTETFWTDGTGPHLAQGDYLPKCPVHAPAPLPAALHPTQGSQGVPKSSGRSHEYQTAKWRFETR